MSRELSAIAYETLSRLSSGPKPTQEINPGLIGKFCREGLIQIVPLKSPYRTHNGRLIEHAQITEKGEAEARRHAGEGFGIV